MEDIQAREGDDARAAGAITGTSPDVIVGIGTFWIPEKDSSFPLSNAAELEPEGRDAEL
jgi:hypothetical protein